MIVLHLLAGLLRQARLLAIPVLVVGPAMLYWLFRVLCVRRVAFTPERLA